MNGVFRVLAILAAMLTFTAHAAALTITAVTAPNLIRPIDGVVYGFNINVSGTYGAADIAAGAPINVSVEYWDDDFFFDDPIDLGGALVVPAPGAVAPGAAWGPVPVLLGVGCRTGPEVFGPAGGTGEGPVMDDGYFYITEGAGLLLINHGSWGYNTVTCVTAPAPGATPPAPTRLVDVGTDCPLPGDPSVPCSPIHRQQVPEPSSLAMAAVGIALLTAARRRRMTKPSADA